MSIEALILPCMIDALEKRDMATVMDIPGALMQADIDKVVHMRLEGTIAKLLVKLNPKMNCKYIQVENKKMVLIVELRKALQYAEFKG